ncbi:unnamed protein product, partial [Dicrocoelium dendriticum]
MSGSESAKEALPSIAPCIAEVYKPSQHGKVQPHEALKFIYNPVRSLAKSSIAMLQRWSVALRAYNYVVEHRSAKFIPHLDYLSRNATVSEANSEMSCLLTQPLPVSRSAIITETRKYYGSLVSG